MRLCWRVFAVVIVCFATRSVAEPSHGSRLLQYKATANDRHADEAVVAPSLLFSNGVSDDFVSDDFVPDDLETTTPHLILVSDETKRKEPDTIILAFMSGKCSTLKIAGRDFACRAVAFYQTEQGRANFTIALDDPADNSHIITFSGENGRKEQDNLYELPIDRMLLKSKDRPKVDGLPAPLVELSTGTCRQLGNFATGQVSSISCAAMDANGKKYELQFDSDDAPIRVMRLRESPVPTERRRVRQTEQTECRRKADVAKVLPRDRTDYIIRCLVEASQMPATDGHQ